jgi:hypothetical protein
MRVTRCLLIGAALAPCFDEIPGHRDVVDPGMLL